MRRVPLPVRFGTLLLGSALVFACAHRTRECTTCSSCSLDRQYLRPSAGKCDGCANTKCDTCTNASPCTTAAKPCSPCATTAQPCLPPAAPAAQPAKPMPAPTIQPAPSGPKAPATTDNKVPRVSIVSVEARESSPSAVPTPPKPEAVTDTKIPRVTIVSVEGSLPATEPFEVPNPRGATPPSPAPPAPPAPSRREQPPSTSSNGESRPQRPVAEGVPANPLCTHASDYSWLVGELRYVPERNVWTVRFASEGEKIDTVTLVAPGPLTGMTSGQLVRVEGHLVATNSSEPNLGYQTHLVSLVNPH